jgi:hypothetical protein
VVHLITVGERRLVDAPGWKRATGCSNCRARTSPAPAQDRQPGLWRIGYDDPDRLAASNQYLNFGKAMRLAQFISKEMEAIVAEWENFAATLLPVANDMSSLELRDHARQILEAVA